MTNLSEMLAKKMKSVTARSGSTLYSKTWKTHTTPAGRSFSRLAVSARRISDYEPGLLQSDLLKPWATPSARDWKDTGDLEKSQFRKDGKERNDTVPRQADLTGWTTPTVGDVANESWETKQARNARHLAEGRNEGKGVGGMTLPMQSVATGWPTPNTPSGGRSVSTEKMDATGRTADGRKHTASLEHAVKFSGWPTPTSKEAAGGEYRDPQKAMERALGPHASDLRDYAQMSGWPTPRVSSINETSNSKDRAGNGKGRLEETIHLAGWPTPRQTDGEKNVRSAEGSEREMERKGGPQDLMQGASLAGWSTPTVAERIRSEEVIAKMAKKRLEEHGQTTVPIYMTEQAQLAGWVSPTATDTKRGGKEARPHDTGIPLTQQVPLSGWPTPMAGTPAQNGNNEAGSNDSSRKMTYLAGKDIAGSGITEDQNYKGPIRLTASGEILTGSSAAMESGGQLNPQLPGWLMGYPESWERCAPFYKDWIAWQNLMKKYQS